MLIHVDYMEILIFTSLHIILIVLISVGKFIDVWEGTSGTSADVPGVGLEMVWVLNW